MSAATDTIRGDVHDYDLRHEQWCPALDSHGRREDTGLVDLLSRAPELVRIDAPTPPGYGALWHVLTALAYRITGLDVQEDTPAQWRRRRDAWLAQGSFTSVPQQLRPDWPGNPDGDPVTAYFDRYADRFTLFGQRPFLQDRRLTRECPSTSGVNKFVLGRPAGDNSATWWTRHHEGQQRTLPPQQAVWWLLVQWYYGAAGRITARNVNGSQTANSKAGMLRNTVTYYPRGATLFDSLMLSLVPPAAARPEDPATAGPDLCPWEWETPPEPDGPPPRPGGMCALLTAVHRHAFLLVPGEDGVQDVYRTWAYRAKTMPPPPAENPFAAYKVDGAEVSPRRARPGRALWRDLEALLPEAWAPASQRAPAFLHDFPEIGVRRGIISVAFSQDPMTTDHEWWMSTSSPVLMQMFDAHDPGHRAAVVGAALRILRAAEDTAGKVLKARLRRAWREGTRGKPDKKSVELWPSQAEPLFWEQAEPLFEQRLLQEAHTAQTGGDLPAAEEETGRRLHALARHIYDQVTAVAAEGASGDEDPYLRFAVIKHRP